MSTHAETVKAATVLSTEALKLAKAAQERLKAAPKTVDPELVKQAAAAVVDNGWTPGLDHAQVAEYLADPAQALQALARLAAKAAGDAQNRLADGTHTETEKAAAENRPVGYYTGQSPADVQFMSRMKRYTQNQ